MDYLSPLHAFAQDKKNMQLDHCSILRVRLGAAAALLFYFPEPVFNIDLQTVREAATTHGTGVPQGNEDINPKMWLTFFAGELIAYDKNGRPKYKGWVMASHPIANRLFDLEEKGFGPLPALRQRYITYGEDYSGHDFPDIGNEMVEWFQRMALGLYGIQIGSHISGKQLDGMITVLEDQVTCRLILIVILLFLYHRANKYFCFLKAKAEEQDRIEAGEQHGEEHAAGEEQQQQQQLPGALAYGLQRFNSFPLIAVDVKNFYLHANRINFLPADWNILPVGLTMANNWRQEIFTYPVSILFLEFNHVI